ncbi:MAG: bifunctional 5,10-methylenetetrahydrofolate dehydrogenase/5,10-methenyltetrahydrofolate cyclohydrolase [Chloroflexi bacterium]|nr:bifunctional 5,10-methylenetetrahydrofolate dehydrogenase/5,10-methenyltetrahydrofolate cyclohydrolase [Chloroflexota bacterium]
MSDAPSGTRARILDGIAIARQVEQEVATEVRRIREDVGRVPGLRILLVGDDPPSHVYAGRILRHAERVGVPGSLLELPGHTDVADIRRQLEAASHDPEVGGVIVQMPLPDGISRHDIASALDPVKDIDGIHPWNAGLLAQARESHRPSCAEAAVEILVRSDIPITGARAVVIGRSDVVGKPAALLLLRHGATVTVCHRSTRDLAAEVRGADIVVVAAGSPGLVHGGMVRPGAVVIDCGINVVDGSVVGDVDRASVEPIANAMTVVPGGVGPVTNAVLLRHHVAAVQALLARS